MNTVVGIDPASKKSVAVVLKEDGYEIHVHTTKAFDMPTRCLEAFMWIRRIVAEIDGPTDVYLELPVFAVGRGGLNALFPLAQVQGSIAAGALSAGATVTQVSVTAWKKAVIGKGNASKLKIKLYLKKHWNLFYLESDGDIDICDAGAIALHGKKITGAKPKGLASARKQLGKRGRSIPDASAHRRSGVVASPRTGVPALAKNPSRKSSR